METQCGNMKSLVGKIIAIHDEIASHKRVQNEMGGTLMIMINFVTKRRIKGARICFHMETQVYMETFSKFSQSVKFWRT